MLPGGNFKVVEVAKAPFWVMWRNMRVWR